MKKVLALAIVLGLFAVPAMAATDEATANVVITVEPYCEFITSSPALSPLVMTVNQDQGPPLPTVEDGLHQATSSFGFKCNVASHIVVTPDYTSNWVIVTPGMEGGDEWPTAYTGGGPLGDPVGSNGIGYGLTLSVEGVSDAWTPADLNCHLNVDPGINADCFLKINTYVDSGRDSTQDNLAAPGEYTGVLTLTLTTGTI